MFLAISLCVCVCDTCSHNQYSGSLNSTKASALGCWRAQCDLKNETLTVTQQISTHILYNLAGTYDQ